MDNLSKAIKLLPVVAKQAAINYVDCLNQPPNAWGQHIESNTGLQSHEYLHTMKQICGESLLESEISELMKRESE